MQRHFIQRYLTHLEKTVNIAQLQNSRVGLGCGWFKARKHKRFYNGSMILDATPFYKTALFPHRDHAIPVARGFVIVLCNLEK